MKHEAGRQIHRVAPAVAGATPQVERTRQVARTTTASIRGVNVAVATATRRGDGRLKAAGELLRVRVAEGWAEDEGVKKPPVGAVDREDVQPGRWLPLAPLP